MSDPELTEYITKNFLRAQDQVDVLWDRLDHAKYIRDSHAHLLGECIVPREMKEGEQIELWSRISPQEERRFVVIFKRGKYHVAERGARDVTK